MKQQNSGHRSGGRIVMRISSTLRGAGAALVAIGVLMSNAASSSLGGPLVLADEGSFFVRGTNERSEFADMRGAAPLAGTIRTGQMYVQFKIPAKSNSVPVILVHGANHSGVTYETTPDGREGWANYFVRSGFPVYVVDQAGRGRSGFNPTDINRAKAKSDTSSMPTIPIATREAAWASYRLGPQYPEFWPDSRFPQAALDHYFSQAAPMGDGTLPGVFGEHTVAGLVALLEKIGPAVVLVHSQSGAYGLAAARAKPDLVRALVSVEGDCAPMSDDDTTKIFNRVPLLSVWADHSVGNKARNDDERRNGCSGSVATIAAKGGPPKFMLLPDLGIKGNSHMMMVETNNLQIADLIMEWIKASAATR
jgi:pimeloyl-ACP methyl ester carboxylesterase